MPGIPFTLPDMGLREISGTIHLLDGMLVFDVVDALAGGFDKDHQVIKVAPSAIDEITLDRRLVRDRLFIRPKKDDLLKAMPGTHGVELPLRIWRNHRARVERLLEDVEELQLNASAE